MRPLLGFLVALALATTLIWSLQHRASSIAADVVDAQFAYMLDAVVSVDNNATSFLARPATFGPLPPVLGTVPGLVDDLTFVAGDACEPFVPTAPETLEIAHKIAVVLRGNCRFYTKVLNLQRAGARAVIVGNNDASGLLNMYMVSPIDEVEIPSVFVSQASWVALQGHLTARLETAPQDFTLLSSIVLFVLSPLLSLTVVYAFLVVQRYQERRRMRAPQHVVDKLPVRAWTDQEAGTWGFGECVICLEPFCKNTKVLTLPCRHEYHETCIRRWLLQQKRTCPICNRPVTGNGSGTASSAASASSSSSDGTPFEGTELAASGAVV